MRSVFFGTPEFAVPALRALHDLTQVVAVVCQPDRRSGRGMQVHAPAVKLAALALGLPVHQPVRVKTGELELWLRALEVDVALVAAYGRILPLGVLAAPKRGCLNLHASILPAYRGAAPIVWALVNGERATGISLMQMDAGMDTGPVYAVRRLPIAPETNAGELTTALANLAADVVRHEFLAALDGRLEPVPQNDNLATAAPPITKEHLSLDWRQSSAQIVNRIRALAPTPGAFTFAGDRRLKVLEARVGSSGVSGAAGQVVAGGAAVEVACGTGTVELWRAQVDGKNAQGGRDLLNGRVLQLGQRLGSAGDWS